MKMPNRLARKFAVCFALVGIALTHSSCSSRHRLQADSATQVITNNMMHIYLELRLASGQHPVFPETLAVLEGTSINPSALVCPGTGSRPGPMAKVDEWTDYIYVSNSDEDVQQGALMISPPENHQEKFGYVLFNSGFVEKLSAEQVRRLIREPWALANGLYANRTSYLTNRITVRVPKRLKTTYPDAFPAGGR